MSSDTVRIVIVDPEKCKPKKCNHQCKRSCPVVKMGKQCITVNKKSSAAEVSEVLCIGCNICVKQCEFDALKIINLPKNLESQTSHRYSANGFKLHRLPMPRVNEVLGLVGTNGIGKSTAIKILAGRLQPNLGRFDEIPDWDMILKNYRGSSLQNYFKNILEEKITCMVKPQYVDQIPKAVRGQVDALLSKKNQRGMKEKLCSTLDLNHVLDREIEQLSGGELQRFAIALVAVRNCNVYMFDEPSSYLDVKQRLRAAETIRSLLTIDHDVYVLCVEHDLSVLDYLSDYICCLYGQPGAYGVVTMPFSVREGINVFLAGFIPTENMRFRNESLTFKVAQSAGNDRSTGQEKKDEGETRAGVYKYPAMTKTLGGAKGRAKFALHVEAGEFTDSQILVLLGENGTGKTTFVRMLGGFLKPDGADATSPPPLDITVSYKPQKIAPRFEGTVRMLLHKNINKSYSHPQFISEVIKPLRVDELYDQQVKHLSGGELQRVAIALGLGRPAHVYLMDEPSAYLDSEQRVIASKVIKRFIMNAKKSAFVVEHDFIMATYLADKVIVYSGNPGIDCTAHTPESLLTGMNTFLKSLKITFRRDPTNFRPRINKMGSVKDQEQKKGGNYFFMDDE